MLSGPVVYPVFESCSIDELGHFQSPAEDSIELCACHATSLRVEWRRVEAIHHGDRRENMGGTMREWVASEWFIECAEHRIVCNRSKSEDDPRLDKFGDEPFANTPLDFLCGGLVARGQAFHCIRNTNVNKSTTIIDTAGFC